MDCLEAIFTRRSIRVFKKIPIDESKVEKLLRAGMSAPSAHNKQPWEFVIITEEKTLSAMAEIIPYGKMLPQSPLAIMICGNMKRAVEDENPLYWVLDCSAAAENILLAAHCMRLGGVWLGVFPRADRIKNLKYLFNLPENIVPHSVLAIGEKDEEGELKNKFDKQKIHREHW